MRSVMGVAALPMSICPHAMLYLRPSREVDLVRPLMACLVDVSGAELGRGVVGFGAFSTRRRDLRPFEFVVCVAGSAACLLDLILNHGHHGMTGDAALAGTVVVQDVTEPKPALLH
jgi:hypothetical protein